MVIRSGDRLGGMGLVGLRQRQGTCFFVHDFPFIIVYTY